MRHLVFAFLLMSCASSRGTLDPSVTPRPADDAPAAVLAQRANVVAVYVNATCDALPTDDMARGTGYWVNGTAVATAGHAMDVREQMFPNFALVGPDGCTDGRYADWLEHVDLLFIMARGHHDGAVAMRAEAPRPGEPLWQFVFQGRDGARGRFVPVRVTAEPLEDSTVFFASKPPPERGDSGAPVFDAEGRLVGMTEAIGSYKERPSRPPIGVHLRALVIRHYLAACAGGGPCGDE